MKRTRLLLLARTIALPFIGYVIHKHSPSTETKYALSLQPHILHPADYPIPRIEDIFASLSSGGEKFSKIDLAQAYNQIELEEESKPYVTVNTPKGLYSYQHLPFGISTAPPIFRKSIEQVLQGLTGVQVYFDDILVTGKDDMEHLKNLEAVMERLSKFGLRIRPDKCEYLQPSVEYLGHVIDKNGLHKATAKVEAILAAPEPKDVTQLRSVLGMFLYRRYCLIAYSRCKRILCN